MPQIDKHAPGLFCWLELATSDQQAGKKYYESLFGWTAEDVSMGPAGVYTTLYLKGKKVAAACTLQPQEVSSGVPPHWNLYISVESADQSAERATELGGRVLMGPFDVMEHGRMAVIQDAQGAVFCLWQAKAHAGIEVKSEPGSLCWADLNTSDQAAAGEFYSALFSWTLEGGPNDYLHIKAGDQFIGGIPSAAQVPPGVPPHWLAYIQVENCGESAQRAAELGGKICFGPEFMENIGTFAVITDPQGAAFSIFQPSPRK